jgi:predicted deacylase
VSPKRQREVRIGGVEIGRGERLVVPLFAARLYTQTRLEIPITVIRGKRDGPRLLLSAALHGDEINGVEVIRRVLKTPGLERKLRGTLVAVPVVNVFAFVQQSRYVPDRRDLNRSFPGSTRGSLASRMARAFLEEVVDGSDLLIDLHTGTNDRCNLPQLRVSPGDARARELARSFGVSVILLSSPPRGTLRRAAVKRGVPVLVFEGGQALRFEEKPIRAGVLGVLRIMREMGMLPPLRRRRRPREPLVTGKSAWIRAPVGGVFRARVELGARVRRRELVGTISDPVGAYERRVLAPSRGIIIGRLERPLVHRGDAVMHLARPDDTPGRAKR